MSNGLFYWRYNPVALDLLPNGERSSRRRYPDCLGAAACAAAVEDKSYGSASDAITASLLKNTVVTFAGYQVMLPGAKGFNNDHLNLNPSALSSRHGRRLPRVRIW
jgi:endoglucanase